MYGYPHSGMAAVMAPGFIGPLQPGDTYSPDDTLIQLGQQETTAAQAQAVYDLLTQAGVQPTGTSQTFTQWLNANSTAVLIGAAALFGGVLLFGGGRRR